MSEVQLLQQCSMSAAGTCYPGAPLHQYQARTDASQSWRQGLQLFEAQACIQVEQRKNEELKTRLKLTAEALKGNGPTPKQSRSQQTRISYIPADASAPPVDQSENMAPQTPKPANARTVRDNSDIYDATPRNLCFRPKLAESSTVQSPASNMTSSEDMDMDDWQVVSPQDRGSPFAESVTTATDAATDIAAEAPADLADETRSECDWAEQIRGLEEVVAELRDGRTDGENKNRISDAMAHLMVLEDLRRLQEGRV
ncbi:hypothetical protein F5X68DRAFT_198706 [Plectosphaerella plurivora]|uniref:Uncharacterized protein n=1 Tax=Plectosphaerella plurivora TaxID=936078 RepID=A0A9P8VM38_9PEZI|nr:hypothetical protein F5X68DRAFT_198706 [Plectosphaerella plurivora]